MNRIFWLLGSSLLLPGVASAQLGVRVGATSTTFQTPTSTTQQSARAGPDASLAQFAAFL